jgi:hypothetical protein
VFGLTWPAFPIKKVSRCFGLHSCDQTFVVHLLLAEGWDQHWVMWVKQCHKPSPKSPQIGGMFTIPKWVVYCCFTHIIPKCNGQSSFSHLHLLRLSDRLVLHSNTRNHIHGRVLKANLKFPQILPTSFPTFGLLSHVLFVPFFEKYTHWNWLKLTVSIDILVFLKKHCEPRESSMSNICPTTLPSNFSCLHILDVGAVAKLHEIHNLQGQCWKNSNTWDPTHFWY